MYKSILFPDKDIRDGGPTATELVRLLEHVDLSSSRNSTPCISPSSSILVGPSSLCLNAEAVAEGAVGGSYTAEETESQSNKVSCALTKLWKWKIL